MTAGRTDVAAPGEARLWVELWPLLLASAVGLLPFTVYSTFLVPIADAAGGEVAAVGALRGLGGVSALVVGVAAAPLIGRFAKRRLSAVALALLSACSLVALHGGYPSLVVFCAGIGTATAVLTPALLAAAAERFTDPAVSGRAEADDVVREGLAAVAAGPVIGLIAWQAGWRGCLIVTAVAAALLAVGFAGRLGAAAAEERPASYRDSIRRLAARPGLIALIAAAALRTAAFMGCLAYLAAWYEHGFAVGATAFTLVWTLSGLSFFLGNYWAGRWIAGSPAQGRANAAMIGGLGAAAVGLVGLFAAPALPFALAATALQSAGHAVGAAAITALIVRRGGPATASALSVNAAGMSLGVFAGAALGGAGLASGSYPGLAAALVLPLLLAIALAAARCVPRRRPRPS